MSKKPTWWRSVAERLVRFLLFVLGPADIDPPGPRLALTEGSTTGGATAGAPDDVPTPPSSGNRITVIPVR